MEDYVPRHVDSITKAAIVYKNICKVQNESKKNFYINKQNIKKYFKLYNFS